MRWAAAFLVVLPLALFSATHRETRAPAAYGRHWAVVSAQPIATSVGAAVLEQGGTAADAAVAVSMALAVVFPEAGNLGGGFLAVGRDAGSGDVWMLDARERAPLAVTYATFATLPPDASLRGPYAAGVPGTVAGLAALHKRYGKLPWRTLVEPAVALAGQGFKLGPKTTKMLLMFRERLEKDPGTRRQFFGQTPVTGAVLKQPELAATLARLAADPNDFYTGETARRIVADAKAYGSPIAEADLRTYEAKWRKPVRCRYRGYDVVSAAPPSSGGVILCQTAQTLTPFLLSALEATGATAVHLTVAAWGQAYRDRSLLGDPDYVANPVTDLTQPAYGASIAGRIRLDRAGLMPAAATAVTAPAEPLETTHFSIVDRAGNAVALTITLNGAFGNGHVVAGAGFLMNNEMDDFNTRPGAPNLYGLVHGAANLPAPGKRMLSSMSPTLVLRGDKLVLVAGTPGGSTIPTQLWQLLTYLIDAGWVLDRAVSQPRFHYQAEPDRIMHEPGAFTPETMRALQAMGYTLQERGRRFGDLHAIAWNTGRKQWMAVADPRGEGAPAAR